MIICLDQTSGVECGGENRDGAKFCGKCGRPLRLTMWLQNIGATIGHYRIVGLLGRGGFGAVYEAEDIQPPRSRVALKETHDASSIASLAKEFEVLKNLRHANLPRYYESFEADGNGYLVMELVPGQNLQEILDRRETPLPETQVLAYAVQLCDVLTYLHSQTPAIIHRDVKPANARITPEGLIKLVDFGLLKLGTGATQSSRRGLTPAYAPLEQYGTASQHTDPRSDVYSLGATIYHLLTNLPPMSVTERVAVVPDPLTPPQRLNPAITNHVARAVVVAMSIKQNDRYPDIATLKKALQGISVPTPASKATVSILFATQHSGTVPIGDLQTLVDTCDRNWEDAQNALFNRDLEVWLGMLQFPDLVKKAAEMRTQLAQEQDRAIELLLAETEKYGAVRTLRPYLHLAPDNVVDLGELHQDVQHTLTIENTGKGFLFGTVRCVTDWLWFNPTRFEGNQPHTLELQTDLSKLAFGQPQTAMLAFNTSGGDLEVPVYVTRVNAQVYLERGATHYNTGVTDQALHAYLQVARVEPSDLQMAQADAAIAVILSDLARWTECFQWMRDHDIGLEWIDAAKLGWQDANANLAQLCKVWADEQYRLNAPQDIQAVLDWYHKANELVPDTVGAEWLAQVYLHQATTLCEANQYAEAFHAFEQAQHVAPTIAHNADLAERFAERARQLVAQRQFAEARARAEQATQIVAAAVPPREMAQLDLAWAHDEYRNENIQQAIAKGESALALDPGNTAIATALARWQRFTRERVQVARVAAALVTIAGLSALAIFIAAILFQFFTRVFLLTAGVAAISGAIVLVASIVLVVRYSVKRLLDPNLGYWNFLLGAGISVSLWSVPALGLACASAIAIARLTLADPDARAWLLSASCAGLFALLLGAITLQQSRHKSQTLGHLFRQTLVGAIAAGLISAFAAIAFNIFSSGQVSPAVASIVASGMAFGITLAWFGVADDELVRGRTSRGKFWFTWLFFNALGIAAALTLASVVHGVLGLILGAMYSGALTGASAFAVAYLLGQGQPGATWKPLFTLRRVFALVCVLTLAVFAINWEQSFDRTIAKILAYENAQAAIRAQDFPAARQQLRALAQLDPQFGDARALLDQIRDIDLNTSTLSVDDPLVAPGERVTFTIVIRNTGGEAASQVLLQNVLPPQLKVVPESLPQNSTLTRVQASDVVNWLGAINPGAAVTVSYQARLAPAANLPAAVTNVVELKSGAVILSRQVTIRIAPSAPTATPRPIRTNTAAPTLTLAPLVTPTPPATATPDAVRLTNSTASWSGTLGAGNWFYIEGKPGEYTTWSDMRFDPNLRFPYCEGGCWRSTFESDFVRLDKLGGHPGATHYVAKRWVSPINGAIRINVLTYKEQTGGNGVTLKVVQNGNVIRQLNLEPAQTKERTVTETIRTTITTGGWIMALVEANGNTDYDHTIFDVTIWQ